MKLKISNPATRLLIQIAAFGFCNSQIQNFPSGKLYTGSWKKFCAPGLNCYSCPAAAFSCPIGALQAVSGSIKFDFSFYVTGFLLAVGVILGRAVCGFLCPFGLIQDLLHKIPSPKLKLWKPLRFVKYAVLIIFVLILPVSSSTGSPAFCQYICPAGTLQGGIPMIATHPELHGSLGGLFFMKASILLIVITGSVFISRFFCKLLCPLGALYGLLNKISLCRVQVDYEKCTGCGKCHAECPMDVNPVTNPRSAECIRCGKCIHGCPAKALKYSFASGTVKITPVPSR
ncbi:MAG TPA: 4Fe-4S ferredoxin [Treponema sp.]|nr:4Fe-4S ferredoxin [Treponema sp.]